MSEIKRVAIYCRVSTEEQASEGYSISAQLQTLRQYTQLYGWQIAEEYVDEGISGKNIKGRPAMTRLVADVEKDKFQAVLVWKISRLSRNMLDTLTLLDKFEDYGVKFISYSENFDTGSPIGRLVVQLMASIAEMERNTLSENVKLGMKQRALEGSWNGGVVFGYDTIEKELVINQDEAKVVQLIYQLYANGKGLKAIANHLNKAGYRTKRNRHFYINGVATILDNVIYNGKISWLKVENWDTKRRRGKNPNPILVEGQHKAIVSDELWSVVQARRKSKSFKQRQSHEPFLLSSLLRCPDCGQGMVPSITTYTRKDGTKRKHRYYVCGDFHNKGSSACKANSIKAYESEDAVINKIDNFLSNKKRLKKTLQDINSNSVDSISQLNKELEQIEDQLPEIALLQNRYLEAFEKNTLPTAILQERLQKVANEKGELEQRKNEITIQLGSTETKIIQPEIIEKLLERFLLIYKETSRDNKKHLLQLLINKITIIQLKERSRTLNKIELDFDFTEVNISKTFTLIHKLYRETDKEDGFSQPLPVSDNKIPPYLQLFLPLFMVRFTAINTKYQSSF
ncbi:recombinase family protein [Oceanobacillus senegalensis]|uniref:recombinase family protein n=1 Tax=Oceanobacillus senegalensis TaxID=1936063 RepID=UPI000A30D9CD|nr:recombinase family protein [Oceanobacillus senegalensis]